MYQIDKTKALDILVDELKVKKALADMTVAEFPVLTDSRLIQAVQHWMECRVVDDVRIYGLSISHVMQKQRCNFLKAVSSLNLLLAADISLEDRERITRFLGKPIVRM